MCQFVHVDLLQVCYGNLFSHEFWCSCLQAAEDFFGGAEVHNALSEEMLLCVANLIPFLSCFYVNIVYNPHVSGQ